MISECLYSGGEICQLNNDQRLVLSSSSFFQSLRAVRAGAGKVLPSGDLQWSSRPDPYGNLAMTFTSLTMIMAPALT